MNADAEFARAEAAFYETARRRPDDGHERWYLFAGRLVQFRIVGAALAARVHKPFAHLEIDRPPIIEADLVVNLWGEAEARGDDRLPRFQTSDGGRFAASRLDRSASFLDRDRAVIAGVADARCLSPYELGRPLHVPLSIWHNDVGVPLIHAGLVSFGEAGILIAGPAGTGKTTTALRCLGAGLDFLGDDLIGLETAREGFFGHSLFGSSFVDSGSTAWLPAPARRAVEKAAGENEKRLLFPGDLAFGRLRRVCEIRAIVLPRVPEGPGRRLEVRSASKAETLLALAPSSLLVGDLSPGHVGFEKLVRLVEGVPLYRFELGDDDERIPDEVRRLCMANPSRAGGSR